MSRRMVGVAGVFILVISLAALAQEVPTTPAASRAEADCSGFIAGTPVPRDIYVLDGADNDYHLSAHQFSKGDFVFLRSRKGINVGAEYALVRPANELFRTPWYRGQHWSMHALGHVYEDVGRVKVTRVTPVGAVAAMAFACGPVNRGDIAIPYQARAIPEYTPRKEFDRFAPPSGKRWGVITAAMNDAGVLGAGGLAYVNLGQTEGVQVGQRFRIFRIVRDRDIGALFFPYTPRESLGEMVIISTHEKSSVGIVVSSVREISLGDGVELE